MQKLWTAGSLALAVLVFGTLAGCETKKSDNIVKKEDMDEHGHHEHKAPHGGVLFALGDEEFHGEVVFDKATNQVTVYILDGAAERAVQTEAAEVKLKYTADGKPVEVVLAAAPDAGDTGGKTSRFQGTDAGLVAVLEKEGDATLSVVIGGKPYSGAPEHEHDHDH